MKLLDPDGREITRGVWLAYVSDPHYSLLKKSKIGKHHVTTTYLGVWWAVDPEPLLYCTRVQPPGCEEPTDYWESTEQAALARHKQCEKEILARC